MKVIAVIPVKGRLPLLKYTIERLYLRNGIYKVICVGDDDNDRILCESVGAEWVRHKNEPLGAKWNAGFVSARRHKPDACLFVGSSDWLSDNYIPEISKLMDKFDMVGKLDIYYADITVRHGLRGCHWNGYQTERKGESIGCGRVLSKKILEAMRWQPFDPELYNSMDYSMLQNVLALGGKIGILEGDETKTLSISTDQWENKHKYNKDSQDFGVTQIEDVPGFLTEYFPEIFKVFDIKKRKYSVIIPTMWRSEKIMRMIKVYKNSDYIDEVIIIDNDHKRNKIQSGGKVKVLRQRENVFVNPAWNMGVEHAKNNWLIIANDDVVISRLDDLLVEAEKTSYDLIGIDYTNSRSNRMIKISPADKLLWGYGCFMILHKSIYKPIHKQLKIWYGANVIFSRAFNPGMFSGVWVETKMGETVNLGFRNVTDQDEKEWKKIQHTYDYVELTQQEGKFIPYTVNVDNYDKPRTDLLCFSEYDRFKHPERNSRIYFILPHKFLDCDISILVSADVKVKVPYQQLVEEWLGNYDMCLFKHPWRDCVYEELRAAETRIKRPDEIEIIRKQYDHYKEIGVPEHIGTLPETGIIIRRHTPIVMRFCEAWWAEMCRWSYRDQCSFPVVLMDFPDLKVNFIQPQVRENPYTQIIASHLK